MKTGSKVAAKAVRRNPAATIAVAAVGVGLLGYALYRKQQKKKLANGSVVNGRPSASARATAATRRWWMSTAISAATPDPSGTLQLTKTAGMSGGFV